MVAVNHQEKGFTIVVALNMDPEVQERLLNGTQRTKRQSLTSIPQESYAHSRNPKPDAVFSNPKP